MDGKIKCYFSLYQVRTNERAELTISMNGTKSDNNKRKTEKHKSVKWKQKSFLVNKENQSSFFFIS